MGTSKLPMVDDSSDFDYLEALEIEIQTLLKELNADSLEKLPQKIKDSPKTIYHLESPLIISDSQI